ncbi:hypothetical protein [Pediococcus pentosaceus]|uniref:hypothetical protein n=1 Tax=Pediococcus pentosaceus TaxID=1255 RepID=UPI003981C2EE
MYFEDEPQEEKPIGTDTLDNELFPDEPIYTNGEELFAAREINSWETIEVLKALNFKESTMPKKEDVF